MPLLRGVFRGRLLSMEGPARETCPEALDVGRFPSAVAGVDAGSRMQRETAGGKAQGAGELTGSYAAVDRRRGRRRLAVMNRLVAVTLKKNRTR